MPSCKPTSRATAARAIICWTLPKAGFTRLSPAEGAFYLYADIAERANDSVAFCARMLAEIGRRRDARRRFRPDARQPLPPLQLLRPRGGHAGGGRAARFAGGNTSRRGHAAARLRRMRARRSGSRPDRRHRLASSQWRGSSVQTRAELEAAGAGAEGRTKISLRQRYQWLSGATSRAFVPAGSASAPTMIGCNSMP